MSRALFGQMDTNAGLSLTTYKLPIKIKISRLIQTNSEPIISN